MKHLGSKSLKELLKSGKTLEVFQVKDKYLNRFRQEAKRYRIAYHIVRDKNDPNQCADIIVDSNNARMCNRIIERYNLQIDMENTKGEVNNEVKETKEISSNTSEQIVEVEEGKDGVSNSFLQEDNPYESILKNRGEFEIKEKMPLKDALDKLKELFSKTRQKIMSDKVITNDRKDNELERE